MAEFADFQRKILNNLSYFGVSFARIAKSGHGSTEKNWNYSLKSITIVGKVIYWTLVTNALGKVIFLISLIFGFFGKIEFLDFIAALDYVFCFLLVLIAFSIWHKRYPFYEILAGSWRSMHNIFIKLGSPADLSSNVYSLQKSILINHSGIILAGCICLMIQYVADCKYVTFTYSLIETDTKLLRFLFGIHEFLFMNVAWNTYAGSCSLCIFQAIALSNVINKMTEAVPRKDQGRAENRSAIKIDHFVTQTHGSTKLHKNKSNFYSINELLLDYKQLTIICSQFNDWVANKTMFMHICGGCQFVSDVFAGTHVMKLPGAGFMDVWFYIEDCFAAGGMLLRTYIFMALVSTASQGFLQTLKVHLATKSRGRQEIRKVAKSLRTISLNVGPCPITPMSVLAVLNTMGNYYVCAALW